METKQTICFVAVFMFLAMKIVTYITYGDETCEEAYWWSRFGKELSPNPGALT